MKRLPVESSALQSVGYNEDNQVLEVEIKDSGRVYQYFEVPIIEYFNLINAPSIGDYYNRVIKKYPIVEEVIE